MNVEPSLKEVLIHELDFYTNEYNTMLNTNTYAENAKGYIRASKTWIEYVLNRIDE